MENIISIDRKNGLTQPEIEYRSLVSVMTYDPYFPRCFEGIKRNLLENKPALVRLHAAADYPTTGEEKYQIDQEGHAVMIVGYDDTINAFAVVDPFRRGLNADVKVDWLTYDDLGITMVDCSLGNTNWGSGLDIIVREKDYGSTLEIAVGLPQVHGSIMDHDCFALENITANITLRHHGGVIREVFSSEESFLVGETTNFKLDLPLMDGHEYEVEVLVNAIIHGNRPYEYRDNIGVDYRHKMVVPTGRQKLLVAAN